MPLDAPKESASLRAKSSLVDILDNLGRYSNRTGRLGCLENQSTFVIGGGEVATIVRGHQELSATVNLGRLVETRVGNPTLVEQVTKLRSAAY